MRTRTLDIRAFGGLPLSVKVQIAPAEPDVGIFHSYVDDWDIVAIGHRPVKTSPKWILDKIKKSEAAFLDLLNEALDSDHW